MLTETQLKGLEADCHKFVEIKGTSKEWALILELIEEVRKSRTNESVGHELKENQLPLSKDNTYIEKLEAVALAAREVGGEYERVWVALEGLDKGVNQYVIQSSDYFTSC